MNYRYILAALVLAPLAGCGGSGGGSSTPTQPSPYDGNFAGTWSSSGGDVGTAQMNITQSGSFTGTIDDTTASETGTIKGTITNGGVMTLTVTFSGGTSHTATGHFTKNSAGDISGTISSTNDGTTTTVQYQFTPNV